MSDLSDAMQELMDVADGYVEQFLMSQRHDLKPKKRTMTLRTLVLSALMRGVIIGAEGEAHRRNDSARDDDTTE